MLVVEIAEVRLGDALVGSEHRPHAAVEPYHRLLHRRPLGGGRCLSGYKELRQRLAVRWRKIEDLAPPAHETIANRHGGRGRRINRNRGVQRRHRGTEFNRPGRLSNRERKGGQARKAQANSTRFRHRPHDLTRLLKLSLKITPRVWRCQDGSVLERRNLSHAMTPDAKMPQFTAPYGPDDAAIASRLLTTARLSPEQDARIDRTATRLIGAIRTTDDRLGGVEDMLREFALSTREGLALMVLAEALLRVPDARTADQFIEDKLGQGDFVHHETRSSAFLVNASAWALGMSARVIQPGETPDGTIGRLVKRLGAPAGRAATRQAMRLMGSHFVLGETIEAALSRAQSGAALRYSFDMLGEGARTADDAQRYFNSYATAIDAIGRSAGGRPLPERPGISVKLSALHPRFEAVSHARVMTELVPRLIDLARRAKSHDLNFTVDAEEADRLELSLDVIAAAFADTSLKGWDGFGLAIQAYQKRAADVIAWTDALARALDRRMMVRLVKGAY